MMNKTLVATMAVGALVMAGCGGGDTSIQDQAADHFIGLVTSDEFLADAGVDDVEIDEECVHAIFGDLSDADAEIINAYDIDETDPPPLSIAGEETFDMLEQCIPEQGGDDT